MLKLNLAMVSQSLKVDEILKKIEVDRHISSRDIATELKSTIKQFLTIYIRLDTKKNNGYQKNNGPSFHL